MNKTNHILLLGGAEHYNFFKYNSRFAGEEWWWTAFKDSQPGDIAFIYLTSPVSRIVGQVEITGEPFLNTAKIFQNEKCDNKYMCPISNVKYFSERHELTIKGLRELFTGEWSWVNYPRGKCRIPSRILPVLLEIING